MAAADLLRDLEDVYQRTLVALEHADPELVIYEESGWRVKDIIAHVATWDAEALRSIYAYRRGSDYSIPNFGGFDDFNAFAAQVRMDEPMAHILADWEGTVKWLHLLVRSSTPDDLTTEMTYPSGRHGQLGVLLQEIHDHRETHLDDIRAALKLS